MALRPINVRQTNGLVYRAETDIAGLLQQVAAIRALADGEKEALGFIPEAAYRDAIEKRRLLAMCTPTPNGPEVAGFVLFSGVFPNARIQQIAVAARHRRIGIASALINEVVSRLEALGYLTITAAVASDLPAAQAFYERNGFVARRSLRGGQARNRVIVLRARDLETASLFSILEPRASASASAADVGLRSRSAGQAPLYAIDLNVLFDVVKDRGRPRAAVAERVIAAALAHQIRLAVAPEFVVELERTTKEEEIDPILKLARQLPRLPTADRGETDRIFGLVHGIVFAGCSESEATSPQALSDARHLAQAALARASGYVTSDGRMLNARETLLQHIGIDVATLDEFAALLPIESVSSDSSYLKGTECAMKPVSVEAVRAYLEAQRAAPSILTEFASTTPTPNLWHSRAVIEANELVAVGVCVSPSNIDAAARVLVHVRPDHVSCETFADHLIDTQCQEACRSGPVTIELPHIPGQSVVRRVAALRGFLPVAQGGTLVKVALAGC